MEDRETMRVQTTMTRKTAIRARMTAGSMAKIAPVATEMPLPPLKPK